MKRKGWYGDNWRHSLASKGISTKNSYFQKKKFPKTNTIKIFAEKHEYGRAYPVTKTDVSKIIAQQKPEDVKGIKSVRFVEPRNEMQKNAWAQYLRGKREIKIFSQPVEEITPQAHFMIKSHVIPHEIGHHVALNRRNITDKDISIAEARADAFAAGFDVEDKDIKRFAQ